jgi:hypothetical protein
MQIQQLSADIARAFKAPLSVTADQVLTDAQWAARALMMLGFDGAGNFGVFAGLNPLNPVSAYIATLLDDADAPTARDARSDREAIGTPRATSSGRNGNATHGAQGRWAPMATLCRRNQGSADGLSYLPTAPFTLENGYLDWSAAGNVLTVAIKTWAGADPSAADPVYVVFRNATAATGSLVKRKVTAANSVSLNNTALIGTVNAVVPPVVRRVRRRWHGAARPHQLPVDGRGRWRGPRCHGALSRFQGGASQARRSPTTRPTTRRPSTPGPPSRRRPTPPLVTGPGKRGLPPPAYGPLGPRAIICNGSVIRFRVL